VKFFQHHIGDYLVATGHLTLVEHGAYHQLLGKYYSEEKSLPADVSEVCRLIGARSKDERAAVNTVLHEFFTLQDGRWHNKRADAEIKKFNSFVEKQRANGLASAAARKRTLDSTVVDIAQKLRMPK